MAEIRKTDGSFYSPNTMNGIVYSLVNHLKNVGKHDRNFMDESDKSFATFHQVFDAQMKMLLEKLCGIPKCERRPLNEDEERHLWNVKVFGNHTALSLLHTVYFYNCKLFGIHTAVSHWRLTCEEFKISCDENGHYIEYTNLNGECKKGMVVKQYVIDTKILDTYREHLDAVGNKSFFYRRPLPSIYGALRYSEQTVGVKRIGSFLKSICESGGLQGHYSTVFSNVTMGTKSCSCLLPEGERPRNRQSSTEALKDILRTSDTPADKRSPKSDRQNTSEVIHVVLFLAASTHFRDFLMNS